MECFGRRDTEYFCHVVLLDESEFPVTIQSSTKGQEVLEKVFDHLNLLEKDYFGLRYIDKSSLSRWLDPMKLVMKQLNSGPPYLLYFCVKFYASDPCCLHEELTRYLFFQQLKRDIFQGRLPCSQNILAEIASYAIQSELGDYCPNQHTPGYVSEFRFIPKQTEELESKINESHKKLTGIVPSVAEFMYLDKAKWLEMYGVDLHLAKGEDDIEYFVALKPAGVVVYNKKTPVGTYLWPKITKIDFKGKKFYLNVMGKEGREYIYIFYLANKSACKHLWKCCVEHHAFFRLDKVQPPPQSNFGGFLRTGSGFRYSGRTQKEALDEGDRIRRAGPWVQRKPSKRYERRDSQVSYRGNVSSQSPMQLNNGVIHTEANINRPITTPDGSSYVRSPQYEMDDSRGPAMPWEELAQTQAGLYTTAPESPRSARSSGSTGKVRRRSRSPKFPKPHRRSGQSSGSETDTSRKRSRSRSAYYSDDDVGRRRRHHKRSHHHHVHSPDSANESYSHSHGSHGNKKIQRVPVSMEEMAKLADSAPYHWDDVTSGEQNTRRHRHHHSHDGQRSYDGRSDGSSRPRQSRGFSDYDQGDSHSEKMVPALDIIQPRVALTREAKELRHRHHRHHRHSHHGNPPSESGQSALSAPPAPSTKLELGPEGDTYGQQASRKAMTSTQNWAPVSDMYDNANRPTFYGSPLRYSNQAQGEAMNRTHDWYSFAKANGHVTNSPPRHMDYIEVVSGPPPHHGNEQLYQYNTPSGKSTFL